MKIFSLIHSGTISLTTGKKIIPAEIFSELLEAKEIIEKAHEDARQLMVETRQECKRLKREATEQGLQQGLEKFNKQLLMLDERTRRVQLEMQSLILPLTLQATKKIVGAELETNADMIVNIVMQAIKPVTTNHNIKIIVNKDDREAIEAQKSDIKNLFEKLDSFGIEDRADISKGSCVIETEAGIINATLDNQWRALESAFEMYSNQHHGQ